MVINYFHIFLAVLAVAVVAAVAAYKPGPFLFFAEEDKKTNFNGGLFTFLALCSVILPVYIIVNLIDLQLVVFIAICVVLCFVVVRYYRHIKKNKDE